MWLGHPAVIKPGRSCFYSKGVCLGTIVIEDEMILTVNSSPRRQPWNTVLSLSQRTVPFLPGTPNLFIYQCSNPVGFRDAVTPLWTLITLVPVCLHALTASPSCSPDMTSLTSPALHSPGHISTPAIRSSKCSHERGKSCGLYARPVDYMELRTCTFLSVCHPDLLTATRTLPTLCVHVHVKGWFKTSCIGDYCNVM